MDRLRTAIGWSSSDRRTRGSKEPFASNISLASRLVLVVLTATIASLVVVSTVSLVHGTALAERLLDARIEALAGLKASEVEDAVNQASSQVTSLANSRMMRDAARRFSSAYASLESGDDRVAARAEEELATYYRESFGPALEEATGAAVASRSLMPDGEVAIYLQHAYIVENSAGPGSEFVVDDAGDGSEWSAVHRDLHPRLLEIGEQFGFEDLYVIEPLFGAIVYSTGKAPDFATSLDRGPYSSSSLATLVRSVRENPQAGTVIRDLAPYPPALGAPVGFVASPIIESERLIGVVAARLPSEAINAIMTSGGDWQDEGLGDTGEAYIVGSDTRMRSISREFIEDPQSYYSAARDAGSISDDDLESVRALGTTILFQDAGDRSALESAAAGRGGLIETTNYLGRPVLSTYEPLDIDQLEWFSVVEIERAEVTQPLTEFRRAILIAASVFVLAITFLTVAWARRALEPVRAISERLRRTTRNEPGDGPTPAAGGSLELTELRSRVDRVLGMAEQLRTELVEATQQRMNTLGRLLPPEIAEQFESGDRGVVEQVRQASVVVVELDGMGGLIDVGDVATSRSSLNTAVMLLDEVAALHGLERVKIVGDLYYAGCGLNHVYLDHAPRAVAFAQAALSGMRNLSGSLSQALRPSIGIDSGPVFVGLAGSLHLVYDVWGDGVNAAYRLAQLASPDVILVSERTRSMLPANVEIERSEADHEGWRLTGSSLDEEMSR